MDRLPLLAIACALRSLAVGGKTLWDKYDNGDNLLFRETDLRSPKAPRCSRNYDDDPASHDLTGYLAIALSCGTNQDSRSCKTCITARTPCVLTAAQEAQPARPPPGA